MERGVAAVLEEGGLGWLLGDFGGWWGGGVEEVAGDFGEVESELAVQVGELALEGFGFVEGFA